MGYSRLLMNTSPMMYGSDVTEVQVRLNQLNYNCGAADGWFGSQTEAAVRAYQIRSYLSVDGIVGPNTWNSLFNSSAIKNVSTGSIDTGRATAQDYRNWGYWVIENADLGALRSCTFAFKKNSAIALCMYLGNSAGVCSTVAGAREAANQLLNMYSRNYGSSFGVSRDGLALELMYHAVPYVIMSKLQNSSNVTMVALSTLVDFKTHLNSHVYWADSGVEDNLRFLDYIATQVLSYLTTVGF